VSSCGGCLRLCDPMSSCHATSHFTPPPPCCYFPSGRSLQNDRVFDCHVQYRVLLGYSIESTLYLTDHHHRPLRRSLSSRRSDESAPTQKAVHRLFRDQMHMRAAANAARRALSTSTRPKKVLMTGSMGQVRSSIPWALRSHPLILAWLVFCLLPAGWAGACTTHARPLRS